MNIAANELANLSKSKTQINNSIERNNFEKEFDHILY